MKYNLTTNTESLWFGDGTDSHSTTSIKESQHITFNSSGSNVYVANTSQSSAGV